MSNVFSRPTPGQPAGGQKNSLGGDIALSLFNSPAIQSALAALFAGFIAKLFGQGKSVSVPASERPLVDDMPDDKIIAAPRPTPATPKPTPADLGYTGMKIGVAKAQYQRAMFPEQYTEDNPFGLYRPAAVPVYNRNSKIWFDSSPLKGSHVVQFEEGQTDGILWSVVYHLIYQGQETICKAGPVGDDGEPIQVIEGESVGCGVTAWKFTKSFGVQIQVGENEGQYSVWSEIPKLGIRTDSIDFSVS